jgi:hypothetical protein
MPTVIATNPRNNKGTNMPFFKDKYLTDSEVTQAMQGLNSDEREEFRGMLKSHSCGGSSTGNTIDSAIIGAVTGSSLLGGLLGGSLLGGFVGDTFEGTSDSWL